VACFSSRKYDHQLTTFYHAFHHDLATKTPHSARPFSKTPLKNTSKTNKNPGSRQGLIFSENNTC